MSVHLAEAKIKAERITHLQMAADKLFGAINAVQPEGIRYAWCMRPDGETFVALVQVDDGVDNPILALREYRELQENMEGWLAERSDSQALTVVGSYRLF